MRRRLLVSSLLAALSTGASASAEAFVLQEGPAAASTAALPGTVTPAPAGTAPAAASTTPPPPAGTVGVPESAPPEPAGQLMKNDQSVFSEKIVDPTLEAAKANRYKGGAVGGASAPTTETVTAASNAFNAPIVDPTLEAAKANAKGAKKPEPVVQPLPTEGGASPTNAFAAPAVDVKKATELNRVAQGLPTTPAPAAAPVEGNAFAAPAVDVKKAAAADRDKGKPKTPATPTAETPTVQGTGNAFAAPAVDVKKAAEASGTPATASKNSAMADKAADPDADKGVATVDAASADSTGSASSSAEAGTSASPGQAGPEVKATTGKPKQLLVALVLNGQDLGLQFVLKTGDRLLVDNGALKDNNAQGQGNSATGLETYRNRQFVDPTQRYPGSTVKLSDAEDKLTITLPGTAFGKQKILLNELAPVVPLTASPSAYLNYSVGESDQRVGSAYVDGGISVGTWLLRSSGSWSADAGWVRGLTDLEKDDQKHLRRWTLGDQSVYSTDGLGGGTSIAGIGVQRAFDLDPYLITLPQPSLSGVLQAPGTIDVYRNGQLIAQRQVGAGPFSLEQLGVGVGQNNVRVVIHDPFGGTREVTQSFYAVNNNLAKGLSEYAYQIGINSPQLGQQYQPHDPVLLARHRWGFTDWLTAGYRVEAEKGLENVGLNTDLRLPFGGFHLAAGASQTNTGTHGTGVNLNYSVSGQRWSLALGGSKMSDGYRRLGDSQIEQLISRLRSSGLIGNGLFNPNNPFYVGDPTANLGLYGDDLINPTTPAQEFENSILSARLKTQVYGTVSYSPFRRLLLQATASRSSYADGRTDKVTSVGANLDLSWASVYLGFDKTRLQNISDRTINMNVTIPLGAQTITASRISRSTGAVNAVDFQRSLPSDTGIGYSVHAEQGNSGVAESADFQAQNRLGRLNLQVYNTPLGKSGNVQLAGSVVFIDKGFYLGRPLTSGYALVRVGDDLKGVPVIRENQPVGKTGSSGSFLVTDLLPYQNNQLGFDQKAIPAAYTMKKTETLVNVPRSGGTVVDFHVRPLKAIRGILTVDGKPLGGGAIVGLTGTPASSRKKEDRKLDPPSPMGSKGNFYLEDVPAGDWTITALFEGKLAKCPIMVPAQKAPVYRINDIHCSWTGVAEDGSVAPMIPQAVPTPAASAPTPVMESTPGTPAATPSLPTSTGQDATAPAPAPAPSTSTGQPPTPTATSMMDPAASPSKK